jgi:zinc transport system permease protein
MLGRVSPRAEPFDGIERILSEFFQSFQQYDYMRHALAAGLLAALACGVIGPYVVVRRIVSISGGIAHAVLGGMGIAYFFGGRPLLGALAAALLAALAIGWVSLRHKQHEDTIIGALWAVGMAIGVIFINRTPGYNQDLMTWLFGDVLLVSRADLWLIAGLDVAIVAVVAVLYRWFAAVCFDEEHARLQGVWVDAVYLLLLCLIALTVVTLIGVVGLILVIALLTLPSAIALLYLHSLGRVMVLATCLGCVFTFGGLAVSYSSDLNSGSTIVLIAAVAYLGALIARGAWSRYGADRTRNANLENRNKPG